MTIAEQVARLKTDFDEVYEAGYSAGESAAGSTKDAYQQGVAYGRQAEYDDFWDAYQENGNRTDYQNMFSGEGWTEETYRPKYHIEHVGNPVYMLYRRCGITNLRDAIEASGKKVTINGSTWQFVFQQSQKLEVIGGLDIGTPIKILSGVFAYCPKLREIQTLPIDEDATQLDFTQIPLLETISFTGTIPTDISFAQSKYLSKSSIKNIIQTLSKNATGKTVTLSKTAVTNAFGSTTADEWTALIAPKIAPNGGWTIILV